MAVTKIKLAQKISERLGISQKDSLNFVDLCVEEIKTLLAEGSNLKIVGLGVFENKLKKARMGRNPHTGKELLLEERKVITFRPSDVLKKDIASKYNHRLNQQGKEDLKIPVKKGEERALKSFRSNLKDKNKQDYDYDYEEIE